MTKLQQLYTKFGQSPWLDNLTRGYLRDGTLDRMIGEGIRGVTANPTIFAKAIGGSADYDEQFSFLIAATLSRVAASLSTAELLTEARQARFERVGEIPFTSERKLMSTLRSDILPTDSPPHVRGRRWRRALITRHHRPQATVAGS